MPHELALQVGEVVLQVDVDFLKIGRIVATFLKIVRIFLNQDVLGYNLRREYVRRNKMRLIPNLEKSARKLENRQESALILEKELFKKIHLNTAHMRIAFYVSIWH
jgi:hypothetical protein